MTDHYAALLEYCCCQDEQGTCLQPCIYIVVDGDWVFLPNSPEPECEGDCHCLAPDRIPDCAEQIATCLCLGNSESLSGSSPPCDYTACGPIEP